jgi:hypothetical protein
MKVSLSKFSKHLWQGPSGVSPSRHSFLLFWQQKHAPFALTFAVLAGALSFRLLRGRTRASDEDSDVCRRFLESYWATSNSSDVELERGAEDKGVGFRLKSSEDRIFAAELNEVAWHGIMAVG